MLVAPELVEHAGALHDEADVEGDCAQFVVAQGLPSGDPTIDDPTVDEPTVGGDPIVNNLPATGASSRLQVMATLMTMIGLALVVVRRRRVI